MNIAVQAHGATAVAGTRRTVTFGGSTTTTATIAAGADLASDPIPMTVTSEQNLLASVHFRATPGVPAGIGTHKKSPTTPHRATSPTTPPPPTTPASDRSWYYLDGLDVQSTTATGSLVAFGDSITDGALSSLSANTRWPNHLARRLQAQPNGPVLGVVNTGIGGN